MNKKAKEDEEWKKNPTLNYDDERFMFMFILCSLYTYEFYEAIKL